MQFIFSYNSVSGVISFTVPGGAVNGQTLVPEEAPFRLQFQIGNQATTVEEVTTVDWTVADVNGDLVYSRLAESGWSTAEATPLLPGDADYIDFPASGFKGLDTDFSVPVSPSFPDTTPPMIVQDGFVQLLARPDGTPLGPTEVAYSITFSEAVVLPGSVNQLKSLFGGVPDSAFISATSDRYNPSFGSSTEWFVTVSGVATGTPVNLTLQPQLAVVSLDALGTTSTAAPQDQDAASVVSDGSNNALFWTKVTLSGDLYGTSPVLQVPLMLKLESESQSGTYQSVTIQAIAASNTDGDVVYIGTTESLEPFEAGYSSRIDDGANSSFSAFGASILDMSGNVLDVGSSVLTPKFQFDIALDQLENSTVINVNSLNTQDHDGIRLDSDGQRFLDTVDFRYLPSDRTWINAKYGEAAILHEDEWYVLDIKDFDRYILNDRWGEGTVDFVGTNDSEYVIVGNGGGYGLDAENSNILSQIPEGASYEEVFALVQTETDIVDYSRSTSAVRLDLGDFYIDDSYNPAGWTEVHYDDLRDVDYIRGFEGVKGSLFNDEIAGSNVGNFIAGGAGNDILYGYSPYVEGIDPLYNPDDFGYFDQEENWRAAYPDEEGDGLLDLDTRDILIGGEGHDVLFGGAGSDMLIDLDGAVMFGSDVSERLADEKSSAEYDMFLVRGDGNENATINGFHMSQDGTGLAGRSKTANDSVIFSIDTTKLGIGAEDFIRDWDQNNADAASEDRAAALYNYVYPKLSFEQEIITYDTDKQRLELKVLFKDGPTGTGQDLLVGSANFADIGRVLNPTDAQVPNQTGVVELKWLSQALADDTNRFNPSIDLDVVGLTGGMDFLSELNVAIALEVQRAGTVRGANQFGVMAASVDDEDLDTRYFNPGNKDDKIIGTIGNEEYEYKVQDFQLDGAKNNFAGDDEILDIGGNRDVLNFESAAVEDVQFYATKVGRESGKDSLKIVYAQDASLDYGAVENAGTVTWKGHFQHGGRQTVEVLELGGAEFGVARAEYEYDHRGRIISESKKIVADDGTLGSAIMVGDAVEADSFVIATPDIHFARIAGFDANDKIDVSALGSEDQVAFNFDSATKTATFSKVNDATQQLLQLSFQDDISSLTLDQFTFNHS